MTDAEILAVLKEDRTIVVENTWYFTGKSMQCNNTQDGINCCDDYYDTFEEAIEAIRFFTGDTEPYIL